MGIIVEILFLAVLCAETVLLPVLCGRPIYFRYKSTSGDIVDNTVEQLGRENMSTAVEFSFVCVLELEITLEVIYPHRHNVYAIRGLINVVTNKH